MYRNSFRHAAVFASLILTTFAATSGAHAQTTKKKVSATAVQPSANRPKPKQNEVRGTQQMNGAVGEFGQIYSLKSGFNYQILSARYSLDPYLSYEAIYPGADQKLLILQVAIKNSGAADAFFDSSAHSFTAVDQNNQDHNGNSYRLESAGDSAANFTLKPAQGLGQKPADPMTVAIVLPANAKIGKIIFNQGRLNSGEEVMRFFVAGTENGNPQNLIAPLPDFARDPGDPSGAVTGAVSPGKPGVYYPSGAFALRLDSFTYLPAEGMLNNEKAEDGKRYATALVTIKNISARENSCYTFAQGEAVSLVTSEGDRTSFLGDAGLRKPARDARPIPAP